MTNNTTKRALISSAIALCLCFVMLIGTTFAWFTDVATSANNVIATGTLDIKLYQYIGGDYKDISESEEPIFGKADSLGANENTSDTLWEPGKTQTVYLAIENAGSLDLKYSVAIEVTNVTNNLTEVLSYIITPDAQSGSITTDPFDVDGAVGTPVNPGINNATVDVSLLARDNASDPFPRHYFALSVHMDELAGNEYQNGNVTFNIKVLAGQLASESDSFDNQYDADAKYPELNYVEIPADDEFPVAGLDIDIYDQQSSKKVGAMTFPAVALADGATHVGGSIVETATYAGGNIAIAAGEEVKYFDITAFGVRENNTDEIKVMVYIGEGLNASTFKVYHRDQLMSNATYDPTDGYVTIRTATFSPFAIVYDADSKHVGPVVTITPGKDLPDGFPVATVVESTEHENVDLPWGSYGSWSPTPNLDSQLEGAFTFACQESLDEAMNNPFASWYCDFYVKLDRDLAANQIFLGGNYGSFGWVGFHNGDLTLAANEEIPLLGSVTSNPWTYVDVAQNVGSFICGVGDVDDALNGATFTVSLRLTNPENENEYYDVQVVTYTFG